MILSKPTRRGFHLNHQARLHNCMSTFKNEMFARHYFIMVTFNTISCEANISSHTHYTVITVGLLRIDRTGVAHSLTKLQPGTYV